MKGGLGAIFFPFSFSCFFLCVLILPCLALGGVGLAMDGI